MKNEKSNIRPTVNNRNRLSTNFFCHFWDQGHQPKMQKRISLENYFKCNRMALEILLNTGIVRINKSYFLLSY